MSYELSGHLATRAYRNLGRNQMLWDAGLPVTAMDNATAVQAKVVNTQIMVIMEIFFRQFFAFWLEIVSQSLS